MNSRISCDPAILLGKPTIKGTRIAVELIMDRLSDGWQMVQLLDSYPSLTEADIYAAIAFTTEVFREEEYIAVNQLKFA